MNNQCVVPETATSPDLLAREEAAFEAHRGELVARAAGEFVLIRGDEVAGIFAAEMDAVGEGYRRYGNTPFLVRPIQAVDEPVVVSTPLMGA